MATYGGKKNISKDVLARGIRAVAPNKVLDKKEMSLSSLRKMSRARLASLYNKYIK